MFFPRKIKHGGAAEAERRFEDSMCLHNTSESSDRAASRNVLVADTCTLPGTVVE